MALLDESNLLAERARHAKFRTNHVGTKRMAKRRGYRSGLQPLDIPSLGTQACGLGWYRAGRRPSKVSFVGPQR